MTEVVRHAHAPPFEVDSRWPFRACAVLVAAQHARVLLEALTGTVGGVPRELTELVAGRVPWGHGLERWGAPFQAGALLLSVGAAAGFVVNRGARLAAGVLLCISLELYWARYSLARLDDYVVNLTCLLLCALPTAPASPRSGAAAYGAAVLGATTWLRLALAFNLVIPATSAPLRAALCAACALPWLRTRSARLALGALTGVAYFALAIRGGAWLAVTLMACLDVGGAVAARRTASAPGVEFVGASTLGVSALLVLALLHGVARLTHQPGLAFRTGRAVALAGMSAPGAYLFHPFERSALALSWAAASGVSGRRSLRAASEETLGYSLRASFAGSDRLRQFAAEHFSNQACGEVEQGPGELTLAERGVPLARVWFDCARSRAVGAVPLARAP